MRSLWQKSTGISCYKPFSSSFWKQWEWAKLDLLYLNWSVVLSLFGKSLVQRWDCFWSHGPVLISSDINGENPITFNQIQIKFGFQIQPKFMHLILPGTCARNSYRAEEQPQSFILTLPSSSTTWICPESHSLTTAPMGTSNSRPVLRSIHT